MEDWGHKKGFHKGHKTNITKIDLWEKESRS